MSVKLRKGFAATYVNDADIESWLSVGWKRDDELAAHKQVNLADLSKDELVALAADRGIKTGKLNKAQLIKALKEPAQEETLVSAPAEDEVEA